MMESSQGEGTGMVYDHKVVIRIVANLPQTNLSPDDEPNECGQPGYRVGNAG